jgi:2-succinyl-5-enolpyruvyl-6-hydroxy-3-cyclohexene-1-carboxylate synthase
MSEPQKKSEQSSVGEAPNATYAFAMAFFEELKRSGVEHVCVSPGSRSTPLAVAAGRTSGLSVWSQLDERSSAFFALGLAKTTRRAVALVCTSGTALANYAPAVIEAHHAGVPLLVLSADRPPELRAWGAGQTIDQVKLFGAQVRYFAELPVPAAGREMLRYARTVACRAVGESTGTQPGPVHLNWPLREPLAPLVANGEHDWAEGDLTAERGRANGKPYVHYEAEEKRAAASQVEALAASLSSVEAGVIACGVMDDPGFAATVTRLASRLGWPVLVEPTSGLRSGPHTGEASIIAGSDLFLRDEAFAKAHRPDAVLRFGLTPVSKAFRLWLEANPPQRLVVVSSTRDWNEPSHLATDFIVADPTTFCEDLSLAIDAKGARFKKSNWQTQFEDADARTQQVLDARLGADARLLEPRATRELCERLPQDTLLYVSNSMPVRDLDAFMPIRETRLRVLANRGANGIDGMVSSALGAAAAEQGHVCLLTGDLAFLYDIGGLLAAQRYNLRATIVVFNNDGGGIFSFLPVAAYGDAVRFEELFTTPHGVDLAAVAPLYGLDHTRVSNWSDYADAIEKSFVHPGVSVIEVPIDREANLEHFRDVVREVGEAVNQRGVDTQGEGV